MRKCRPARRCAGAGPRADAEVPAPARRPDLFEIRTCAAGVDPPPL